MHCNCYLELSEILASITHETPDSAMLLSLIYRSFDYVDKG